MAKKKAGGKRGGGKGGGEGRNASPPLYAIRDTGIWWNKRERDGRSTPTQLSNFSASISAEITEDDGSGDPRTLFEICARVPGDNRSRTVTVAAHAG